MSVEISHYSNGNIKEIKVTNKKGEPHNTDGPAVQGWYANGQEGIREFCVNGKLHNPEGPAFQRWYENGQEERRAYWVNGKTLSEKEFNRLKNTVEITVEGKTKRISRQSAEELNLV